MFALQLALLIYPDLVKWLVQSLEKETIYYGKHYGIQI